MSAAVQRALVTGAAGFIGGHLADHLARIGWQVRALDLDRDTLRKKLGDRAEIELLADDLAGRETSAVADVDTVFHLAAAHLGAAVPAAEFTRVNVTATAALASAAREAGVRRFVHVSSVGVYGPLAETPADENTPCHPELPYERTKLAGEEEIRHAMAAGLPAVILRPAWVYGPGCPRTEKLFRAIGRGRFVLAGDGEALRHCLYIDDMLAACERAADAEEAVGQTMVLGDAAPVTVRRLLLEIAELTATRPPLRVPLTLFLSGAALVEALFRALGREPPLSRRTARFFTGNTAFRIDRMRRLLAFEPRYTLRVGLAETWRRLQEGGRR